MNKLLKRLCAFLTLLIIILCQLPLSVTAQETEKIKDERASVPLPVIMYHDIINNSNRNDLYTITTWAFEEDIKWLHNNGYTTVSIDEIIDYVENGTKLPDKPIVLTFDDGHYNNITNAEPILGKYGMKGVMFVTGEFCDKSVAEGAKNPAYSYVFWDEQRRMADSGIWDIESHTYYLHRNMNGFNGVAKRGDENEDQYRARLRNDFESITEKIYESSGVRPQAFAYPFGVLSNIAEEILTELDYKVTFTSYGGTGELRVGDLTSLRLTKRHLRTPNKPVSSFLR